MTYDDSIKRLTYDDFIERFNSIKSDLRRRGKINYFNLRPEFNKLITDLINNKDQKDSKCSIRRLLIEEFNWTDEDALSFTDRLSRLKDKFVQTLMFDKFDLYDCIWLLLVRYLNNTPLVCFDMFKSCLDGIIYDATISLKGCYGDMHSSLITSYENEVKPEHLYNYSRSWNKTVGDCISSTVFDSVFGTDISTNHGGGSIPFRSTFDTYLQQNNYSDIDLSSYVKLYELMVRSCDYMGRESVCLEQIKKYLEEGLISIDFDNFSIKTTKTSSLKHFSDIKFIYIYSMRYDTCGFVSLKELSKLIFPFKCYDAVNASDIDIAYSMRSTILTNTYKSYIKITDTLLAGEYLSLSFIDYLEDNKCPFKKMEVESQNGNIIFSHDLSDRLNKF